MWEVKGENKRKWWKLCQYTKYIPVSMKNDSLPQCTLDILQFESNDVSQWKRGGGKGGGGRRGGWKRTISKNLQKKDAKGVPLYFDSQQNY